MYGRINMVDAAFRGALTFKEIKLYIKDEMDKIVAFLLKKP